MDILIHIDQMGVNVWTDAALPPLVVRLMRSEPFPPSALALLTRRWIDCQACGEVNNSWQQECAACQAPLILPDFPDVDIPA
jgi:hypothetical protein